MRRHPTRGLDQGTPRRTAYIALAIALLTLGLLTLVGCGIAGPANVSIAELANHQDVYIGQQVTAAGRVVAFSDPSGRYFVLEDDAWVNMVELRPARTAAPHAGVRVSVTGRFGFDPRSGRYIDIANVTAQ